MLSQNSAIDQNARVPRKETVPWGAHGETGGKLKGFRMERTTEENVRSESASCSRLCGARGRGPCACRVTIWWGKCVHPYPKGHRGIFRFHWRTGFLNLDNMPCLGLKFCSSWFFFSFLKGSDNKCSSSRLDIVNSGPNRSFLFTDSDSWRLKQFDFQLPASGIRLACKRAFNIYLARVRPRPLPATALALAPASGLSRLAYGHGLPEGLRPSRPYRRHPSETEAGASPCLT